LVDVECPPHPVHDVGHEVSRRCRHAANEYTLLAGPDFLDLLARDQEQLPPEAAAANLEQIRLVDPRDEAQSFDVPDDAGR
jgi:hypothetical protein